MNTQMYKYHLPVYDLTSKPTCSMPSLQGKLSSTR